MSKAPNSIARVAPTTPYKSSRPMRGDGTPAKAAEKVWSHSAIVRKIVDLHPGDELTIRQRRGEHNSTVTTYRISHPYNQETCAPARMVDVTDEEEHQYELPSANMLITDIVVTAGHALPSKTPVRRPIQLSMNDDDASSEAQQLPSTPPPSYAPTQLSVAGSYSLSQQFLGSPPAQGSHAGQVGLSPLPTQSSQLLAYAAPSLGSNRPLAPPPNVIPPPQQPPFQPQATPTPPQPPHLASAPVMAAPVPMPTLQPPSAQPLFPPAAVALMANLSPTVITWPRATGGAPVANFLVPVPKVAHLPHHLKKSWSAAVTNVLGGYADENDVQKRSVTMGAIQQCPAKLNPQTKQRMARRTIGVPTAAEVLGMELPATRPAKATTDEQRTMNRACSLVIDGQVGKGAKVLFNTHARLGDDARTLQIFCGLNPLRVEDIPLCPTSYTVTLKVPKPKPRKDKKEATLDDPLKVLIGGWRGGKSAGPSGWTEELIYDAITKENSKHFLALFTDIVNGTLEEDALRSLRRGNLAAIPKADDGIRPLTMGETLVKVSAKMLLKTEGRVMDTNSVGDFQYAFRKGGVEQVVHQVRADLRSDPNRHVILVDCTNAFNTIRRKAIQEQLVSDVRYAPLYKMFNAFYVPQGELLIRDSTGQATVICSTEGVRQGDVLGPLLFCIGLKPAVEKAQAIMATRHPEMRVEFLAYMDDITIVGCEAGCKAAFDILKHELEALSLMVNTSKTITTSSAISEALSCKLADTPKLLGAFVGRSVENEKAIVDTLPDDHELFFNRVSKLPAQIAYNILVKCGVPRWAHLIRTHQPEVVKEASTCFNEMVARCLANIICVDYNEMDANVYRQIRLPVRHGGLGLIDWTELCEEAYAASLNNESNKDGGDDFDEFMPTNSDIGHVENSKWTALMEALQTECPTLYKHLARHSTKMASAWLTAPPTFEAMHSSNAFRAAILFRLGWAGAHPDSPTPFACECGFPTAAAHTTTTRDMLEHMYGCTRTGAPTKRHHLIRDKLIELFTQAGYSCKREDPLDDTPDPPRMDIITHAVGTGQPTFVDVTVANSLCRTHKGKEVSAVLKEAHKEKSAKYQGFADAAGAKFVTFGLDIHGTMNKDAQDIIKIIHTGIKSRCQDPEEQKSLTQAATIQQISQALAMGNSLCFLLSKRVRRFGIHFDREPVYISSPRSLARGRSENDNLGVQPVVAASAVEGRGNADDALMEL